MTGTIIMALDPFSIYVLVEAVWLILPAYAANGLAPLFKGGGLVDFGRNFIDGRPLFGKGKTFGGLFGGMLAGALIGLVEMLAFPYLPWGLSDRALQILPMGPALGLALGAGAMLGDLGGAFAKRRLGMARGRPAPILDQDDFIIGSLLAASLLVAIRPEWWILLLVMTPAIHFAACVIGYLLGVKKEPW